MQSGREPILPVKYPLYTALGLLAALSYGCNTAPADEVTATLADTPKATLVRTDEVRSAAAVSSEVPESLTPAPTSALLLTPTLGAPVTRTPGPEEGCPKVSVKDIGLTAEGGGSVSEIFEQQLLDYLNAAGSASGLTEKLGALTMLGGAWEARPQVETIDVTGNTTPEVIIELTFFEAGQYSESALFVYQCEEEAFVGGTVLSKSGQVLSRDHPDGIRAIRDMNADGVPEIVHSYISIAGTHAYFIREFSILEWDGDGFVDLIAAGESGFKAQADTGDGEIRDLDRNGTYELILTNSLRQAYPDLGPQRVRSDIWEWTGYGFERNRWKYTEPVFRIHAIWDGDDATLFGDYEAALAFYQQAIFDDDLLGWSAGRLWPDSYYGGAPPPAPDPEERHRLNAYGRYRIMLLHAAQGNQPAAEIVYNTLQENYSGPVVGGQYAALASEFWDEYSASDDISQACSEAVKFAGPKILSLLGKSFYGIGQREYEAEDICPFGP